MSEGFQHAIAGGQGNLVATQPPVPQLHPTPLSGWEVLKSGYA